MSMITRCPACETMFRVVPDQLRISAGWVRCGQCDEVFDASAHLLDSTPTTGSSTVDPVAAKPLLDVSRDAPPAPFETSDLIEPESLAEAPQSAELSLPYSSDFHDVDINLAEASTEQVLVAEPPPERDEGDLVLPDAEEFEDSPLESKTVESNVEFEEGEKHGLASPELAVEPISFLLNESEAPAGRRIARRWPLLVSSLLLVLGLISQGVYRERHRLAAWEPRMGPWLERACETMGCALGPPQNIDSISIDSSTFATRRSDTYRLSFSLKNSASTPVAFPAIELTLTDAQDRPLLRRVLQASEVDLVGTALAAVSERSVSIDIAAQSTAMPDRVAGYRLVAFYP